MMQRVLVGVMLENLGLHWASKQNFTKAALRAIYSFGKVFVTGSREVRRTIFTFKTRTFR